MVPFSYKKGCFILFNMSVDIEFYIDIFDDIKYF